MKRVSVDELKAAYEKTGFLPGAGAFEWKKGDKQYCCAFLALYYAKFGTFPSDLIEVAFQLGYDFDYVCWFIYAWDGDGGLFSPMEEKQYIGYEDGIHAVKVLNPAFFGETFAEEDE